MGERIASDRRYAAPAVAMPHAPEGITIMIDVVVGAGPNGLMLACELALAGVHPVVLERRAAPTGEPRANGLVGQVVRLLDRRGLYARLSGGPPDPSSLAALVGGARARR
ncbi:FAD-dependent monooxygenase [Micromonospora mangrovi]|uniref:FAD-dependent monooxygenase n=1 Tax=Micromonospora mangrovi TaxID=1182597 RepID=A0ABV8MID9_9ACTN